VSKEDVACYRLYAANCVEAGERISDTERKFFFLRMAQAWGKLADQVERSAFAISGDAAERRPDASEAQVDRPGLTRRGWERRAFVSPLGKLFLIDD
jgi:hypothetical protein